MKVIFDERKEIIKLSKLDPEMQTRINNLAKEFTVSPHTLNKYLQTHPSIDTSKGTVIDRLIKVKQELQDL